MIGALIREARPKQWAKNLLVFAAPGAAGVMDDRSFALDAVWAFLAFCLVASGTYYINDLRDLAADRGHPTKRTRPIAAGEIPEAVAMLVAVVLFAGGVALSAAIGWHFLIVVGVYVVVTLAYSAGLKRVAVVDLTLVAAGFLIRAIGGAVAVDIPMSTWFLLCTAFGSLFIVTGKRYAELGELGDDAAAHRSTLELYTPGYLRIVLAVATTSMLMSYCIWAFETKEVSGSTWPFYELSIVPVVMAVLRYLLLVEHGRGAAPEELFVGDRALQVLGVIWIVVFGLGVYVG